jgi:hypothetical protein
MAPLLHIVCLRFRDDLSEEFIRAHFENDVALSRRMPHLVSSWRFAKNHSLASRADVNGGCQWVVLSTLFDASMLETYINHPEHREVGAIQAPLLTGKFVVDVDA